MVILFSFELNRFFFLDFKRAIYFLFTTLWVTAHRTGEQGLVFQDLVENIDEAIDPNQVFSWFHDNITKEEAVDMLVKG